MYEKYKKKEADLIDDDVFDRAVNLVKSGGSTGSLTAQKDAALNAYLNREDFKYNVNNDALYHQYKDKYIQQGKTAMQDTMGQAAALTGGYGSSYAQNVGQQAYNSHLQKLNDVVPELYQMAYDRYQDKGAELLQRYGLLADEEREAYDRQYQKERDVVSDQRYDEEFAYQKERDIKSDEQWQQGFDYQKERDAVSDQRYDEEFKYQKGRDAVSDSQWERNFTENQRQFNQSYVLEALDQGKESESETYTYAYTDPETNRVHYLTSDGKDVEFEKGINPNTGDRAPNLDKGTFGRAGYQQKYLDDEGTQELSDLGVFDGTHVYQYDGVLYQWNDSTGKYEEYDGYVTMNTQAIKDFNGDLKTDWTYQTAPEGTKKELLRKKIMSWLKAKKITEDEAAALTLEHQLLPEDE